MGVKVRERDGAWWLFVDHQGQRKSRRVGTGPEGKRAAKSAAEQIAAKLALGDSAWLSPPVSVPTFQEYATTWLQVYPATRGISQTTQENYRSTVQAHLIPSLGALRMCDLDYSAVERFAACKRRAGGSPLTKRPLKDSSLQICLGILRMICERAVRDGILSRNPVPGTVRFTRRLDQVDPFTTSELRAILNAAQVPDFRTMLRLWMSTGMREGEVLGLQWQDLDLAAATVLVRHSWTRGRLGPTKTRRQRVVSLLHPVTEETVLAASTASTGSWRPWSRLLVNDLKALTVRPLEPDGFVFGGQAPWGPARVRGAWRRVLLRAGVRYRAPETLRHTFASTMLSRGAPLLYCQQQGGWASATVLLQSYARWMPSADLPAAPEPRQPADMASV